MPPKRAGNEPVDATEQPTARKRSRTKAPDRDGEGKRLPIMQRRTARMNKKEADDDERRRQRRAEANTRRNDKKRAATAERKRKEEEIRKRRQEVDDGEVEMDEAVLRVIEGAQTTVAAALKRYLGTVIALGEAEADAAVLAAVERELELDGIEDVNLEELSRNRGQLRQFANEGAPAEDVHGLETRQEAVSQQEDDDTHCRPRDTSKQYARGRNIGGCGRAFTNENPPVNCYYERCGKVKFCTDCKENQHKGKLVYLDGDQEWFCTERCVDTYNREAEEENAKADRTDAAKKARTKENKRKCGCGNIFTAQNPDTGPGEVPEV
ncbi:hypothetical protein FKW77_004779 [Venturia effusa]|uniref:Uncharacterized protein n=1 Tax=Venturia effusa TaxID=50376 RepID=A0A517LQ28_9PEZI|nr:hypothetical protein FKW77_004779 [Venturia effusa]